MFDKSQIKMQRFEHIYCPIRKGRTARYVLPTSSCSQTGSWVLVHFNKTVHEIEVKFVKHFSSFRQEIFH